MQIKICDVKDIHTARLCGNAKINMIGLHAIFKLKKKNIRSYKMICEELIRNYPQTAPVLVTKIKDPDQLINILKRLEIEYIQLYVFDQDSLNNLNNIRKSSLKDGSTNNNYHFEEVLLNNLVQDMISLKIKINNEFGKGKKFIFAVPIQGINIENILYVMKGLKNSADYFLLDTETHGGTGIVADNHRRKILLGESKPIRTIIAGGLKPENVNEVIQSIYPYDVFGVDVQSGVSEKDPVRGDPKNAYSIINFIKNVRAINFQDIRSDLVSYPKSRNHLVSWAITDLNINDDIVKKFNIMKKTNIDIVHLDFSDGSVAPDFYKMPFDLLENLTYYFPCMNYDIHLFIENIEYQKDIVEKCLNENPLLRVAYYHVLNKQGILEEIHSVSDMLRTFGVKLGLAIQSTQFTEITLKSFWDEIIRSPKPLNFTEVSLITHSSRHLLSDVLPHDKILLDYLTHTINQALVPINLGIDRDMTIEKARGLSRGTRISQIIVGKEINNLLSQFFREKSEIEMAKVIQKRINSFRNCLLR